MSPRHPAPRQAPAESPSTAPAPAAPGRPDLRDAVRRGAENRPGIYRFVGLRGEVLYVGKSVRVRSRLLSYFRGASGSRQAELLRSAEGVEWEYVPNEFEALLREFRQIRAFKPRFNVRHRRERRYAWIRLTPGPAPRLVATRAPRADGSRYFGPFPAPANLPRLLRELAVEAGLRDCPDSTPMHFADQLDLLAAPRTPGCMRAELGSCPAPCAAECTVAEYRRGVDRVAAFLEGNERGGARMPGGSDDVLAGARARLSRAIRAREYEHAARLRDRIEGLEALGDRVREFAQHLARLDLVYEVPGTGAAEDRRYVVLGGRVRITIGEDHRADAAPPREPVLAARVERMLEACAPDPASLSPGEREELFLVARWFRDRPEELERTRPVHDFLEELRGRDPRAGSPRGGA